jgi:hypothetical protein
MSRPLYWTDIRHAPASRFESERFTALRAAYAAAPLLAGYPPGKPSRDDASYQAAFGEHYPGG